MRVALAAVGRLKAGPERDLFDRYVVRSRALARSARIASVDVVEIDEGRGRSSDERKSAEADALEGRFVPGTYVVVLDERGQSMTSLSFAASIDRTRDAGVPAFVVAVGGADGFDPAFREKANATLAFGSATLPHQLVRILAAEQVYRAFTILTGHPYHRS